MDIDNDGWLGLFVCLLEGQCSLVLNQAGPFSESGIQPLPHLGAGLVLAPAFADLDGDGSLEILLGKYSSGMAGHNLEIARNAPTVP